MSTLGVLFSQVKKLVTFDPNFRFVGYSPTLDKDEYIPFPDLITYLQSNLGLKQIFNPTSITNVANAYTGLDTDLTTYLIKAIYIFQPNVDSTGSVTLAINSLTSYPVMVFQGGSLVAATDLKAINTYILIFKGSYWLVSGGGSGGSVFASDWLVSNSANLPFGIYPIGSTVPATGKSAEQVLLQAYSGFYRESVITGFNMAGQGTSVETGTVIFGTKTFNWSIALNSGVVPTVNIWDTITNTNLTSGGTPNDGSQAVAIGSITRNTAGQSYNWQIRATDTNNSVALTPVNFSVVFRNLVFYGATSANPTDSASARALSSNFQYSGATTFILNTGNSQLKFAVVLEVGKVITQVIDLDALNVNITSQYILIGNINVLDAGSNTTSRPLYVCTISIPYSVSHRHQISVS